MIGHEPIRELLVYTRDLLDSAADFAARAEPSLRALSRAAAKFMDDPEPPRPRKKPVRKPAPPEAPVSDLDRARARRALASKGYPVGGDE